MKSCFAEVTVSRRLALVEFADVSSGGTALFKTVEAFIGAFFLSTSMERKQRAWGGGGEGRGGSWP